MKRRAFTLVELLVVMAIISTLVGLTLVAVQAAREAARKAACLHNIRQMGLALQHYHQAKGAFPPSSTWDSEADVEVANTPNLRANWVVLLLPFIDEQPLYDQFDLSPGVYLSSDSVTSPGTSNKSARGFYLASMLCPSDSNNRMPFDGGVQGNGWGRGNYAANAGLGYLSKTQKCNELTVDGVAAGCAAFPDSPGWQSPLRGVMGANVGLSTANLRDGSSHTLVLGEIRAGLTPSDPRGVWAMSGAAPSSLWAHGLTGGDNGLNASRVNDPTEPNDDDDIGTGGAVLAAFPNGAFDLVGMGMPCNPASTPNWQQTIRSSHAMGAHVAMADGSARFLSDSINTGFRTPALFTDRNDPNYNLDRLSVWDRIMMVGDRQPVSGDQLGD